MRLRFEPAAILLLAALIGCNKSAPSVDQPVVAAILMQQDQFFRLNENGMQAAAADLKIDLKAQNAGGAIDKEITLTESFAAQKVGAILVSPLSAQGSIPALRRAADAGIKIVTYNNTVNADFVGCAIASDQVALGAITGQAARDFIEKKLGGKAKVAIIGFTSQLPEQGGARVRGFKQALQSLPGVLIIAEQDAWEAPQAATAVTELLTKSPDIIWAANEGGTVGAVTAIKNAGKAGKCFVFGTDITNQLIDFLLSPDNILQAVTAQKPFEMGRAAVESAVKLIHNQPVEKTQVLPGMLFTREKPDELRAYQQQLQQAAR